MNVLLRSSHELFCEKLHTVYITLGFCTQVVKPKLYKTHCVLYNSGQPRSSPWAPKPFGLKPFRPKAVWPQSLVASQSYIKHTMFYITLGSQRAALGPNSPLASKPFRLKAVLLPSLHSSIASGLILDWAKTACEKCPNRVLSNIFLANKGWGALLSALVRMLRRMRTSNIKLAFCAKHPEGLLGSGFRV